MKTATNEHYEPLPYPQTPVTARQWFKAHGICVSRWARHFGFHRNDIADLLRNGKLKGNWGRAHYAAIALGLKPAPKTPSTQIKLGLKAEADGRTPS